MKKKFLGLKYIKKEEGFVLITILMIFVIVSILGIGLLSVSTSNFRQTGSERDFQAVYYIAEAGINQAIYDIGKKVDEISDETLSHVDFFEKLNDFIDTYMDDGVKTLDNFEETFGEKPIATITIEADDAGLVIEDESAQTKGTTKYIIRSVGKIGNLTRTVSTSIEVAHGITKETETSHHPAFDYALYSGGNSALTVPNDATINGDIYGYKVIGGNSNSTINGNAISLTDVELAHGTTINGNLYAHGFFNTHGDVILRSSNGTVSGDIHAKGSVTLQSGSAVKSSIYAGENVDLRNSQMYPRGVHGDIHAGGNITRESYPYTSTYIGGNSYAGGNINQHMEDNINMSIPLRESPNFILKNPVDPPNLLSISPDMSKDIKVPQGSSNFIIAPGIYGDLIIDGASTVSFKSGNYIFNSIDGARWGQTLRLDLIDGSINIYVVNNIKYSGAIEVSQDGVNWIRIDNLNKETAVNLAGKVYWEVHGNFHLTDHNGNYRQWFGTILSNGDITTESGAQMYGSYSTIKGLINIKTTNARITYAPPTDSAASGGGGSGDVNEKGKNSISSEYRITTSSPIREK